MKGMPGVGLGRLPAGIDADDDPDSFGGVGVGVGEEQGGGGGNGVGGGRGDASLYDELEAEEKRYVLIQYLAQSEEWFLG